jgi:hypothetical protein
MSYIVFHIGLTFRLELEMRLVWSLWGLSWCTRGDANFKRRRVSSIRLTG